jgi:hypothetical protein
MLVRVIIWRYTTWRFIASRIWQYVRAIVLTSTKKIKPEQWQKKGKQVK